MFSANRSAVIALVLALIFVLAATVPAYAGQPGPWQHRETAAERSARILREYEAGAAAANCANGHTDSCSTNTGTSGQGSSQGSSQGSGQGSSQAGQGSTDAGTGSQADTSRRAGRSGTRRNVTAPPSGVQN